MKTLIIINALTSLLTVQSAIAAPALKPREYRQFFLVDGKEHTPEAALVLALGGHDAYKCVSIQPSVSKSGTSIALKNVKKPKTSN